MRIVPALLLGCALLLPARAAAQDSTSFTPSHLAAARELMEAMHLQEASLAGVSVMLDAQIRQDPAMEPFRATMTEWGRELFASAEATNAFAALYAETFSEAEIRELIAFYRSPVGQRVARSQAMLATRGAEIGRALATAHQADLIDRIQRASTKP